MTTNTDVVNIALQVLGTRTTVTDDELANNTTNEAIQTNLILTKYRDQLLRMAPWNCGVVYDNLIYLCSVPGTPENTSPATTFWTPGQPAPPWAYEYLYPDDCLRACFIIPGSQTGFAGGVPITTAVTGGAPAFWQGQPSRFKVALDKYFREGSGLAIVNGGSGFAVNDLVTLGTDTLNQQFNAGEVPAGIVQIKVTGVAAGVITTATLFAYTNLNKTSLLYAVPTYNLAQVQTTGAGTGAIVSISGVGANAFAARTILTNQEFATLAYVKQVTDPNIMDPDFIDAWAKVLGAGVCMALTGDKALANNAVAMANAKIVQARSNDGNEGLTINDVTPDWIRVRGILSAQYDNGPWSGFDWGSNWPTY